MPKVWSLDDLKAEPRARRLDANSAARLDDLMVPLTESRKVAGKELSLVRSKAAKMVAWLETNLEHLWVTPQIQASLLKLAEI